jgi:hypothetical protein
MLERKVEQRPQGWQRSLLMPGCRPDTKFSFRRREGVGENKGALLGQPKWGLIAAATVIECNESSRKLAPGIDPLQLSFGDVVAKKEPGAKRTRLIAAHKQINVPNVIRFENNDCRWRTRIEALPYF